MLGGQLIPKVWVAFIWRQSKEPSVAYKEGVCSTCIFQNKQLREYATTQLHRGKEFAASLLCFPSLRSCLTCGRMLFPWRSPQFPGVFEPEAHSSRNTWNTLWCWHCPVAFCFVLWVIPFGVQVLRVITSLKACRVWGKVIGLLLQTSWWNYWEKSFST